MNNDKLKQVQKLIELFYKAIDLQQKSSKDKKIFLSHGTLFSRIDKTLSDNTYEMDEVFYTCHSYKKGSKYVVGFDMDTQSREINPIQAKEYLDDIISKNIKDAASDTKKIREVCDAIDRLHEFYTSDFSVGDFVLTEYNQLRSLLNVENLKVTKVVAMDIAGIGLQLDAPSHLKYKKISNDEAYKIVCKTIKELLEHE